MSLEWRGGPARPVNVTGISTTGQKIYFNETTQQNKRGTTKWLRIKNTGANPLRIFFTQEAFDDAGGTDYVELPVLVATNMDHVLEGPIEAEELWLKSGAATTTAEIMPLMRRG